MTVTVEIRRGIPRLPAAPLLEAVDAHCAACGVSRRRALGEAGKKRYWRAQAAGIVSPSVGRRLCDLIGIDPREVYGEAWQEPTITRTWGPPPVTLRPHLGSGPLVDAIEARVRRVVEQLTPLVDLSTAQGETMRRVFGGDETLRRAFYRARRRGWVVLDTADRLCDVFGWHPREIWGDAYDEAALAGAPADFDPWAGVA